MKKAKTFTFSLASLNTHGILFPSPQVTERYVAICQHFEHVPLNLINFQEVWSYHQLTVLQRALPSYPYCVYQRGILGPEAGLVTLSRFPLGHPQFLNIPSVAEPRKKKWINRLKRAVKKKGALVCCLAEWPLIICNTHLVANGDGDWSQSSRYYSAHMHDVTALATLITDLSHRSNETDILVSGDFNFPKCSDLYQKFVKLSYATDIFEGEETPTFHKEFLVSGQQAHCIDYIFLRSQHPLQIKKKMYLFQEMVTLPSGETRYLSDHLGLLVEAELECLSCPTIPRIAL